MRGLLIIDMQNDFMPGGRLAVPKGDEILPLIRQLMTHFPLVVATQDVHPSDDPSFAANHPGKKVGDSVTIEGVEQTLWPLHCVRGTKGAELVEALPRDSISKVFCKRDYSAFFDRGREGSTGLEEYLRSKEVDELVIVGVATDYCILHSVLDAIALGFSVTVIQESCRGVNLHPGDVERAFAEMRERGYHQCQ